MADVRLTPMTDAEYAAFAAIAQDDYATRIAESGTMSWEAAVEKASADVAVYAPFRRRGYGRAIMLAGESVARSLGATVLGLNVRGGNVAARALYEQLGYDTMSVQIQKRL